MADVDPMNFVFSSKGVDNDFRYCRTIGKVIEGSPACEASIIMNLGSTVIADR